MNLMSLFRAPRHDAQPKTDPKAAMKAVECTIKADVIEEAVRDWKTETVQAVGSLVRRNEELERLLRDGTQLAGADDVDLVALGRWVAKAKAAL